MKGGPRMISTATNVASYDSELAGKIVRDALQFSDFGIARESIDGISSQHVLSLYPEMNSFDARVATPFSSRLNKLFRLADKERRVTFGPTPVTTSKLEFAISEFCKIFGRVDSPEKQAMLKGNPTLSLLSWFYLSCIEIYRADSTSPDVEEGIEVIRSNTAVAPWVTVASHRGLWKYEGYNMITHKYPYANAVERRGYFIEMYKSHVKTFFLDYYDPVGRTFIKLLNFMLQTTALAHVIEADRLGKEVERMGLHARSRAFDEAGLYENAKNSLQLYFDFSAKIDALPDPEMRVA